ncbi:ASTRA complex subunit, partial [Lunasporangiospora selenospora]
MLVAYEDGSVTLFREGSLPKMAGGGAGARLSKREMEVLWSVKRHREPVLALDISRDRRFGISCGSDNILVKYQLENRDTQGTPEIDTISLKANGIADVRIRDDSKIVALAGWDGRIRVFSSKTLKPLAVLSYHREGLYCLGFANVSTKAVSRSSDAKGSIGNALGAGSQEGMVSGEEASVKKMKNDGEKSSSSKSEDDDDDNSDDSDDSDDGEALEER